MDGSGSALTSDKNKFSQNTFDSEMEYYLGGGYGSVTEALSEQSLNHIRRNMTETTEPLYRVEESFFTANNLSVGQEFSFNRDMRAFTTSKGLDDMKFDIADSFSDPVYFKTVGKVKRFDVNSHFKGYSEYSYQQEQFISGRFKVKRIYNRSGRKYVEIEQISNS